MSRTKLSLLIIGVIAAAGLVLTGANYLVTSSTDQSAATATSCESGAKAKTASSCPVSSCTKSAQASTSCATMKSAQAGGGKSCTASSSCMKSCEGKATKTASVETIDKREGARVVLLGHYVCGRCELGVSDASCQPAFQTKDGKNYLLVKNNLTNELRSGARDNDVEIVTRVKKLDGAKYLEVEVVRQPS